MDISHLSLEDTKRIDEVDDDDASLPEVSAWMDDLLQDEDSNTIVDENSDLFRALTPLEMLAATFGGQFSTLQIQGLLEQQDYDLDAVFESLTGSGQPNTKPVVKVCRFFLQGSCLRSDCKFSHDMGRRVCKYYLMGTCGKGTACEFVHDLSTTPTLPVSQPKQAPPSRPILTSDDFPSLGGKTTSKPTTPFMAGRFNQAVSKNLSSKPPPPKPSTPSIPSASKQPKKHVSDVSWTDTGASVAQLYKANREQGIAAAKQRNRYFELAKECYLRGDGAGAKKYSQLAREENAKMENLHWQAATAIYESRNRSNTKTIDLHGLHVNEAIVFIKQRLDGMEKGSTLQVLTGTGHHSSLTTKAGRPKILPELEAWCSKNGFRCKEGTMSDGRGGLLLITK